MEIVVYAKTFTSGRWKDWEHACSKEETEGVEDSARAYAMNRLSFDGPAPIDYLRGAKYIFDVTRGLENDPREGDTLVVGASVNGVLIGASEELSRYIHDPKKVA